MMRPTGAIAGLLLALAAPAAAQEAVTGTGALLRGLDKINGTSRDVEVAQGGAVALGNLQIELGECRYPAGNPAGDAYAYLTIREPGRDQPIYRGWMIASAPALNPMDHARYDVWIIRCNT